MQVKCKKCGRPLHDPASIARGMGPACAGTAGKGSSSSPGRNVRRGKEYSFAASNHGSMELFSGNENRRRKVPKVLEAFPSELIDLVLLAPAPGSIATGIKKYSQQQKKDKAHFIGLVKQIRRTCIECRLLFWPGLFMKSEALACIPQGTGWKIGQKGRIIDKDELIAYLGKYGIIPPEQHQTTK